VQTERQDNPVPFRDRANQVDDASRLLQIRARPEEAIMSLTDFCAIAGMLAVLGGIGCLMYFKFMKH